MMQLWKCNTHSRVTEIFCNKCGTYLCVECLSKHANQEHTTDYLHVAKQATDMTLPLLDKMMSDPTAQEPAKNVEADKFIGILTELVPNLSKSVSEHNKSIQILKALATRIDMYTAPIPQQPYAERISKGLATDRKLLEEAIKTKDVETILKITTKIEGSSKKPEAIEKKKGLIEKIKYAVAQLSNVMPYKDLCAGAKDVFFQCQQLRLHQFLTGWKLDRNYLTTKMTLSENGLEYGNQAGAGYPAIIGDTPFESGMICYEVYPTSLCCSGKEGFGLVELEIYKVKFAADSTTPVIYDEMLGITHGGVVKNMNVISGSSLTSGEKYIVKADLTSLTMTIKGSGCFLAAELKPSTVYVPCFSCGCRSNKIRINILDHDPIE